jgi:hypothetical protein
VGAGWVESGGFGVVVFDGDGVEGGCVSRFGVHELLAVPVEGVAEHFAVGFVDGDLVRVVDVDVVLGEPNPPGFYVDSALAWT